MFGPLQETRKNETTPTRQLSLRQLAVGERGAHEDRNRRTATARSTPEDAALAEAETPLAEVSAEPRAEASDMEHEGLLPLERETRGCR